MTACFLSAFISNTAAAAFFLPVVFNAAIRRSESPSGYLMPLAFASILSSSVTLVSTSTNIVVSEMMQKNGLDKLGFFELSPVGIPIAITGLLYMWFIGRKIIPDRSSAAEQDFGLRPFLFEVLVLPDAALIGKTIKNSEIEEKLNVKILRLIRNKRYMLPSLSVEIKEGDSLLIEGAKLDLLKIKELPGLDLKADAKLVDPDIDNSEVALAEAIIMPSSGLIGRTLKNLKFQEKFDLIVLGIGRTDSIIRSKISQVKLQLGDILLLQGRPQKIQHLADYNKVSIMGKVEEKTPNYRKASLAIGIFAFSMFLGMSSPLPLSVAVLIGAVAVFLCGCITPEEAFQNLEWRLLVLISSMFAIGTAIDTSGAADLTASVLTTKLNTLSPLAILAVVFVATVILTQFMSNQGAAIILLPVAFKLAAELGLNPRSFAITIAVAGSCSYLTPLEPACLLVYRPGNYRFMDFFKVGAGLSIIILIITLLLVPYFWPL